MWQLTKSEIIRFTKPAVAFALLHLVTLRAVATFTDLFSFSRATLAVGLAVYLFAGIVFGYYQFGSYKKVNTWTYLIHRPLAPGRIFGALSGAGALFFLVVVALPVFLATFISDVLSPQWIDTRYYLMTPYAYGVVLSFYFIGSLIALSASRAAVLALVLPTFFLTRQAQGVWVFVPVLIVLAALWFQCSAAFKPNLTTLVRRPGAVTLATLTGQYAILWITSVAVMIGWSTAVAVTEHGWRSFAVHRWDTYFPVGTLEYASYRDGPEILSLGLGHLDSQHARQLREAIDNAEVREVRPLVKSFATSGQLPIADRRLVVHDADRSVEWTFSHDQHLFQGRNVRTGVVTGWLGRRGPIGEHPHLVDDTSRFPSVPYVWGSFIVARQEMYEFELESQTVSLRMSLDDDEQFAGPLESHGGFLTVLTNQALHFIKAPVSESDVGLLETDLVLPIQGSLSNLMRINLAELNDGYLVSFLYGAQSERGYGSAKLITAQLFENGSVDILSDIALTQGSPDWLRHRGFILSPAMATLSEVAWLWIGGGRDNAVTLSGMITSPLPRQVVLAALILAVSGAGLTFWIASRRSISRRARWVWTVVSFFSGVPGVISFLFLTESREPWLVVRNGAPMS